MNQAAKLEERTDEEIMRILKEEYHFEFQDPLHSEAPTPKTEYVGESPRIVDCVNRIRSYLLDMYIINDSFGIYHSARRVFTDRFEREHHTTFLHRRSKLRGNNNLTVLWCAEMIGDVVKRRSPETYETLSGIFPPERGIFSEEIYSGMRRYNKMTFDEKVNFAGEMDRAAYRFLEALSE